MKATHAAGIELPPVPAPAYEAICKDGGAIAFLGIQKSCGAKCGDSVLFRSPRGSTLSVPLAKLSVDNVRIRIAASEIEFNTEAV